MQMRSVLTQRVILMRAQGAEDLLARFLVRKNHKAVATEYTGT